MRTLASCCHQTWTGTMRRYPSQSQARPPGPVATWASEGRIMFLRDWDVYAVDLSGGTVVRVTKTGFVGDYALSHNGASMAICDEESSRVVLGAVKGGGTPVTLVDVLNDPVDHGSRVSSAWTQEGGEVVMATSALGVNSMAWCTSIPKTDSVQDSTTASVRSCEGSSRTTIRRDESTVLLRRCRGSRDCPDQPTESTEPTNRPGSVGSVNSVTGQPVSPAITRPPESTRPKRRRRPQRRE